ncbi:MAG: Frag1/DRAM/Sfk1 family protein [Candidatus Poseidoniaceae archaeon]|nr:Frag1/DRAM/Sfk1 family protein [Candidatus Poseidoniaceae archaeon]
MRASQRRRLVIVSTVVITTLWLAAGYITWVMNGCKAYMPFISDFDLYEPGDTIFTLGTLVTGYLVFWVIMEIHSMNMKRITLGGHHTFWHGVNHLAVFPGLIGAFSCIRIGSVPWDTDGPMHGHYAFDIFIFGVYWCLLITAVTVRIWWTHPNFRRVIGLRVFAALSAFVGLFQLIATQAEVWGPDFDWDAYNALTADMMAFCTSSPYPMLNVSAAWEYVLVFGMLGTILSFLPEVEDEDISRDEESE